MARGWALRLLFLASLARRRFMVRSFVFVLSYFLFTAMVSAQENTLCDDLLGLSTSPKATAVLAAMDKVPKDNGAKPYPEILQDFATFQSEVNAAFATNEPVHDFLWNLAQVTRQYEASALQTELIVSPLLDPGIPQRFKEKARHIHIARNLILELMVQLRADSPVPQIFAGENHRDFFTLLFFGKSASFQQPLVELLKAWIDTLKSTPDLKADSFLNDPVQKNALQAVLREARSQIKISDGLSLHFYLLE
jgi:hypothetical protein